MQNILKFLDLFPGRQMRRDFFNRCIPPLWFWLRAAFMFSVGAALMSFGLPSYGRILMTLATVQLVGSVLAVFFQELAKAINRYSGTKPKKSKSIDIDG